MANPNLFQQYMQPARSVVDYENDYAKADALKNQNAMQSLTLQQAANVQTQRNALRDLVQSGQTDLTTPDGQAKAISIAPDVAPALVKSVQDGVTSGAAAMKDKAQAGNFTASTGKIDQETLSAKRQQHFSDLATVNTPEDALQWGADGVRLGIISPDKFPAAVQALQQAAQTPEGFAQWKQQAMSNSMTAADQLKQQTAAPTEVKLGNVTKFIDMNPHSTTFGKEVAPAQNVGVSPDTVANNQTSRANNAATIAAENTRAANQVTYQADADGNMVALPTKVAPGSTIKGQPVVDSTGKVIPGKSSLTETQGKATTFAARMADADSTINALEKKGVSGSDLRTIAAGNGLTNWAASPEGQEYRQAQENWVTANLRQESGAAIGKDEMEKDVRKFFPAPGDGDAVKAQKARARAVAQQGMVMQAGPGARSIPGILSNASATQASPTVAGDVPPDIAAILAKHGGK